MIWWVSPQHCFLIITQFLTGRTLWKMWTIATDLLGCDPAVTLTAPFSFLFRGHIFQSIIPTFWDAFITKMLSWQYCQGLNFMKECIMWMGNVSAVPYTDHIQHWSHFSEAPSFSFFFFPLFFSSYCVSTGWLHSAWKTSLGFISACATDLFPHSSQASSGG